MPNLKNFSYPHKYMYSCMYRLKGFLTTCILVDKPSMFVFRLCWYVLEVVDVVSS